MTTSSLLLLFISMVVLAIIPGPGILVVVARTLAGGFKHGIAASIGIVLGDYVFILLAVYGLIAVAEAMGGLFIIIKYLGAAYLCWLGIGLIRQKHNAQQVQAGDKSAYATDCAVGLITTLSNPKAILFYLSFFPTFLDLTAMTTVDIGLILLVATVAVGGVMVSYAFIAAKATNLFKSKQFNRRINLTAGGVLIGSGALMALKQ